MDDLILRINELEKEIEALKVKLAEVQKVADEALNRAKDAHNHLFPCI